MPPIARTKGTNHIFANISATNKDIDLKFGVCFPRVYSHNILQAEIHPIVFVMSQSIMNFIFLQYLASRPAYEVYLPAAFIWLHFYALFHICLFS